MRKKPADTSTRIVNCPGQSQGLPDTKLGTEYQAPETTIFPYCSTLNKLVKSDISHSCAFFANGLFILSLHII